MGEPTFIAGYPGIVELPTLPGYAQGKGFSAARRYRGPVAQIQQFMQVLADAASCTAVRVVDQSPTFCTIEASYSDAQDGADPPTELLEVKWDRQGNDLEKDIFTHPDFQALGGDDAQALRDYRDGKKKHDDYQWGSSQALLDFFDLVFLKVQSYSVSQFVMRKTAIIALGTTYTEVLTHAGKVYPDTAAFIAGEGVPTVPFTIPEGEWLIRTPTAVAQGKGRWQVTQEFWHAEEWSSRLYTHL